MSYSAPLRSDVLYRDYNHRGRLTIERVREVLPSNNFRFYVCGPGEMMESLVPALWEWGVPESHVHFEAFGPASVKSVSQSTRAQHAEPCEVRFERSGRAAMWDGSFASLLGVRRSGRRRDAVRLPGRQLRRVHDGDPQRQRSRRSSKPAFRCRPGIA